MPIAHIVVATDFSPDADSALAQAIALAKAHSAKLTVVYAEASNSVIDGEVDGGGKRGPESLAVLGEIERENKVDDSRQLAERFAHIRDAGVHGIAESRAGAPDVVVSEVAQACNADLIVVGTHGRTGITRFLLGSTAERIVRRAICDVLVVRRTEAREGFDFPMVATDFSPASTAALQRAIELSRPGVQVQVVHAWQLPVGSWGLNLIGSTTKAAHVVHDAITDVAQERGEVFLTENLSRRNPTSFELVEGEPADVITELAAARGCDLLAVGGHGHTALHALLLGGVTERFLRHAPCAVLVCRANATK